MTVDTPGHRAPFWARLARRTGLMRAAPALRKLADVARKRARNLAILAVVLIALYLLQQHLPLQAWLQQGAETYRGLGTAGMFLFALTYAGLVMILAPGPALSLTAGALYGLEAGYLVAASGALLASLAVYLLAGTLLRRKAAHWVSRYPAFRAIRSAGGEEPARALFSLHTSPVLPAAVAHAMLTLSGIRLPLYALGAWLGMMPGILFYVYVGMLGGGVALDRNGLSPRALWTFGIARVALWGLGFAGTVQFGLLVKRHAAKTHASTSLDPVPEERA